MWQLRMHCNLRSPDATPVLFRFNCDAHCQVWNRSTYPLPNYNILTVDTLRFAVSRILKYYIMTYLRTEQINKELNEANARYRWILLGGISAQRFSGVRGPNFIELGEDIGRSWLRKKFVSEFRYLAAFSIAGGSKLSDSRVMLKTTPNFAPFDRLWKLGEGWARSL